MFEDEYDSYESIPAAVRHLFKKDGEKYILIQAGEIKTVQDVANVQEGLRKEREDHKDTKKKLAAFGNMDPEEVQTQLDRIPELEAAAEGKGIDQEKMNQLVETRLRSKTAPLERQITQLTEENNELKGTVQGFETKEKRRTIHDHVRKAASAAKVRDTAMEDILLLSENIFQVDESGNVVTKDNVGVTPGVQADVWFTEVKNSRPHWWPESQGVGAKGGDGTNAGVSNPFAHDTWNLTEQGKLLKSDRTKAEQLAKAAGTEIGGPKPQKK